jgi:hypothetical protein
MWQVAACHFSREFCTNPRNVSNCQPIGRGVLRSTVFKIVLQIHKVLVLNGNLLIQDNITERLKKSNEQLYSGLNLLNLDLDLYPQNKV